MPRGYWKGRSVTWTPEQVTALQTAYSGTAIGLNALAAEIGKHKSNVSRKARELGLTRRGRLHTAETARGIGKKTKTRIAAHGHPRGMLGKKHSPEARARMVASQRKVEAEGRRNNQPISDATRRKMSEAMHKRLTSGANVYSRCKSGRRPDLDNTFFRSRWEANYARVLNLLASAGTIATWAHEPDTFWFLEIKRGVRSYLPDFKVWRPDGTVYYVEVKGWMDKKSATKLKRMRIYHPTVEVQLVGAKEYRYLAKTVSGMIPTWESEK